MRLKKTKIRNFQSISSMDIEHGDITVIVGASDVGKSALMRSLYMLNRNALSSSMVRTGESTLSVSQEFENGAKVEIEKGSSVNRYLLKTAVLDKTYSKIGKDIPDEVRDTLNTDLLTLDKDQELDLNFSLQFGRTSYPFLLDDSNTTVTKTISSISGIQIVYAAIREATNQSTKLKTKMTSIQETIVFLEKYEGIGKEFEKVEKFKDGLEIYIEENTALEKQISHLKNKSEQLVALSTKQIDVSKQENVMATVQTICNSLYLVENELVLMKDLLRKIASIKTFVDIDPLLRENKVNEIALDFIADRDKELLKLLVLSKKLDIADSSLTETEISIKALEKEVEALKATIKVCDACGRPF